MRARIGCDSAFASRGSTRPACCLAMSSDLNPFRVVPTHERRNPAESARSRTATTTTRSRRFYDAFTAGSDYEAWTSHVLALARAHGLRGTTLLDLACGTGKSFVPFLRARLRGHRLRLLAGDARRGCRKAPGRRARRTPTCASCPRSAASTSSPASTTRSTTCSRRTSWPRLRSMPRTCSAGGLALFDLNTLLAYRTTFARRQRLCATGRVFAVAGRVARRRRARLPRRRRIESSPRARTGSTSA